MGQNWGKVIQAVEKTKNDLKSKRAPPQVVYCAEECISRLYSIQEEVEGGNLENKGWYHKKLPKKPKYNPLIYQVAIGVFNKIGFNVMYGKQMGRLADSLFKKPSEEWAAYVDLDQWPWHRLLLDEGVLEAKHKGVANSSTRFYRFRKKGIEWIKENFPNLK